MTTCDVEHWILFYVDADIISLCDSHKNVVVIIFVVPFQKAISLIGISIDWCSCVGSFVIIDFVIIDFVIIDFVIIDFTHIDVYSSGNDIPISQYFTLNVFYRKYF